MARSVGISREQVITVAAELADRHGLEQLALAHVAAQLGVRLPSLYNHVAGLPGLRHELAIHGLQELLSRVSRAVLGKAGDEAVIALGLAVRQFVLERPGLYAATVQAPAPDDEALQALSQQILEVIFVVLAPYKLDDQTRIHAARGLRSLAHGFATLEQAAGFAIPIDQTESFCWLLQVFLRGLRQINDEL